MTDTFDPSTDQAPPGANGRPHPPVPPETAPPSPLSDTQSAILVDSVRRASRVGLVLRTALFGVSILAATLALVYTMRRGDEMVNEILSRDRATDLLWERVVALTLPVLLFLLLGAVCVAGAYVLQSRALDERERALDAISRIRREEVGASRARTLARLAEDDLTHARREFAMQVGFGRATWVLSMALLGVSVIYSLATRDLDGYSAAFGAGGVLTYLLGVLLKVPTTVRCNLSALSQRHLIVSGFAREIGIIEADAYRRISQARRPVEAGMSPDAAAAARNIRAATGTAVSRMERYCKNGHEAESQR